MSPRLLTNQPHRQTVQGDQSSDLRILFVEDDAIILMSSVEMLEDLGHAVASASSGGEALAILQSETPFDLLITDFSMPKMTGAQLAVAARLIDPALPILLTTGYRELPSDSGVDLPTLSKPYSQDQLQAEIEKALKRRQNDSGD